MLTQDEILHEFREANALLKGHFLLSSGRHAETYMQCARVLMEPSRAEKLCRALAEKLKASGVLEGVSLVIAPPMGGIIVGYEMGRQLNLPSIFFERVSGEFELRRGFEITPGQKCLLVDDVVTTGLSLRESIEVVEKMGANVVAATALVDRSNGAAELTVPLVPLLRLDIPTYAADNLPPHLQSIPAIKPGSRGLTK